MTVYTVGLTGMSGAGKTTACEVFADAGFHVIDCDKAARDVVQPGRPALTAISAYFGNEVLDRGGGLDRRRLGSIVFADSAALKALDDIIYPYITYSIIFTMIGSGRKLFLLDAPTLFESGADKLCDTVVCVTAEREKCTQRIMARDSLTRAQAEARLSSQHGAEFYITRSCYSAVNNGRLDEFEGRLRGIAREIMKTAGGAA